MTYTQPVLPICLAVLTASFLFRRTWRYSRGFGALATFVLFLWSWHPVAFFLVHTLERPYPIRQYPVGDAQAIVVLGGSAFPRDTSRPEAWPSISTYVRTSYASWLYRNWRPLPIVASGGSNGDEPYPMSVAEVMHRVLIEQGVPEAMVSTETRSSSTYENALYSAALLRAKGIHRVALVTDALAMARAERTFQRQGLEVTPAPCCYTTEHFDWRWTVFVPSASAIQENEAALHEWIALFWYRLRGRS